MLEGFKYDAVVFDQLGVQIVAGARVHAVVLVELVVARLPLLRGERGDV